MFGLKEDDIEMIKNIFEKFKDVEKAVVFGSRAKGTNKPGSDLDIAVFGKAIPNATISRLSFELNEETLMPYHFDIINFTTITNTDLKNHIIRVGKIIFKKQ